MANEQRRTGRLQNNELRPQELESRLWSAADELRANSDLTLQEYSRPVLGLIFLRYADVKFTAAWAELEKSRGTSRRRSVSKVDYHARGVLYLPEEARYSTLLNLPEGANLGANVNGHEGHRAGKRRAQRRIAQDLPPPAKPGAGLPAQEF